MISFFRNRRNLLIIHLLLGFIFTISPLNKILVVLFIITSIFSVYTSKNEEEQAFLWAGYFVSSEVFYRMSGGSITWEQSKYVVMLLLIIGLVVERKKHPIAIIFLLYFFVLFLGIIKTEVPYSESIRKAIVFNLSGPVTLGIAAFYFYKRNISKEVIANFIFYSCLPIISMVVYLYFKTPDIREITFGGAANFATSGGFGPNQVSTALGWGAFCLAILLIIKESLSGYKIIDVLILAYVLYRLLLTFSRGGAITGVAALICFLFFYTLSQKNTSKLLLKYLSIGVIVLISAWIYAVNITGGMLINRYTNKNASGKVKKDISSGRVDIFENQIQNFSDNPILGIGVGSGKYMRQESDLSVTAASHNEIGRLIEEHGLIGVLILIILILTPLIHASQCSNYNRAFLLAFLAFWFLTINHSAMRIAFPGFIYALSLITISDKNEKK